MKALRSLTNFLIQKSPQKKPKIKKSNSEEKEDSLKFIDIINNDNVFNKNVYIGLTALLAVIF